MTEKTIAKAVKQAKRNPWSASQFRRRMKCWGSAQFEQGLPEVSDETETEWAQSGTRIHAAAAHPDPRPLPDPEEQQMVADVRDEYGKFQAWASSNQGFFGFEKQVTIRDKHGLTISTGHVDFFAIGQHHNGGADEWRGVVFDLKTGWGDPDLEFWRVQGLIYALGLLQGDERLNVVEVRFYQGRTKRPWHFSVRRDEMEAEVAALSRAYRRKYSKTLKLAAGSHCRWCRARGICPALTEEAREITKVSRLDKLPVEKLAELLEMAGAVDKQVKAVRSEAKKRLRAGETIPGWWMKPKNGARYVTDPSRLWLDVLSEEFTAEEFNALLSFKISDAENLWAKKKGFSGEDGDAFRSLAEAKRDFHYQLDSRLLLSRHPKTEELAKGEPLQQRKVEGEKE